MAKIPARRVPSDDCAVHVGRKIEGKQITDPGVEYHIHEGEWVDVIPVATIRQYLAIRDLQSGKEAQMEGGLDKLCIQLAERLIAWNWTDNEGAALPQPYHHPEVLQNLSEDELLWLLTASLGETLGERKKRLARFRVELAEDGPETSEAIISGICKEFGCLPSEALREEPIIVFSVIEHRALKFTQTNIDDVEKLTPEQIELWKEMERT